MLHNRDAKRSEESKQMNWGEELVDGHCPYCAEPVQLLVDPSANAQRYVEDCQVCCQPMTVIVMSTDPVVMRLQHEDEV